VEQSVLIAHDALRYLVAVDLAADPYQLQQCIMLL
jgi:hypothetical protein